MGKGGNASQIANSPKGYTKGLARLATNLIIFLPMICDTLPRYYGKANPTRCRKQPHEIFAGL